MRKRDSFMVTALLGMVLCGGCGGGGDDDGNASHGGGGSSAPPAEAVAGPPPPAPPVSTPDGKVPEGFYVGTTSDGYEHRTFILEDGRYFMVFGPAVTGVFILAGMLEGHGHVDDGAFTSEDLKFFLPVTLPGRLGLRFTDDGRLQGTVAKGSGTGSSVDGGKVAWLDYDAPARLADVAGPWAMRDMSGNGFQVRIAADGALTGTQGACALSGAISPRASGKNVFDVSLAYGEAPCRFPGAAFSGIAVSYVPKAGAAREFFLTGVDRWRLNGFFIYGARSTS